MFTTNFELIFYQRNYDMKEKFYKLPCRDEPLTEEEIKSIDEDSMIYMEPTDEEIAEINREYLEKIKNLQDEDVIDLTISNKNN